MGKLVAASQHSGGHCWRAPRLERYFLKTSDECPCRINGAKRMLLGKSSAREVRPAPWGTSVEKSWLFAGLTELPDTTGSQVGICVADCKMQANGVVGLLTRTPLSGVNYSF